MHRKPGTGCAHEHACVRCPVLIVHATERPQLVEIRDNLLALMLVAEREGWIGEVEGLQSSLCHAEEKLAQLDAQIGCHLRRCSLAAGTEHGASDELHPHG
jgi:hypothetical protein